MKKVTIKDVAKKSNVSTRTVSRVINDDPNVKKETREKVLKVIKELDFEVNVFARTLRTRKTKLIVVFIDNRNGQYWGTYHNEFFNELYWIAKEKGYKMVISPSSHETYQDDTNDGFSLIKNKLCDGAIIFDANVSDQRINYLNENNIPYIVIGNSIDTQSQCFVGMDNRKAGYMAAKHLKEKGYEKLAILVGNDTSIVNSLRIEGFKKYCEEEKIPHEVSLGNIDLQHIYKNSSQLMKDSAVDGFFVSGDERAIGVYRAIVDQNLKVGFNIGVIGIDNLQVGEYMYPSLTTIASPKKEIAQFTIQMLIKNIREKEKMKYSTSFSPILIERESTIKNK